MDAKPAAALRLNALLAVLCFTVAAVGVSWSAWDMFASPRQPMLQGWDDSYYYFWLPSVVIDHDVDFSNQLAHSGTIDLALQAEALAQPPTPLGLPQNKYPPGWALGSLPFFLAAHAFAPAGSLGFEPRYLLTVWCGQLLYAAAGLWLAIKILGRYFPASMATTAVLAGWLASPLIYYQTARLSMSHSQVFALAMLVFWLSLKIGDGGARPRHWLALGFSAALLAVTRNLAVVYLVLPALIVLRTVRTAAPLGWLLLGAAGPALVQLVAWKTLYGSWLVYSYGGERFNFTHLHLREVLFSAQHGWFYAHPLMAAGVAGFLAWAWPRAEGRAWLFSLGAILVLNAAWPMWWLGSSFGQRGFEVPVFFAMLGLAVLQQATAARPWTRFVLGTLTATAIAWNLAFGALFLTQRIPREAPVTYADTARALLQWVRPDR